jgi:hypothetical protein
MVSRFEALSTTAPDVVSAWDGIEAERFLSVRREVRRRAGLGTAPMLVPQLAATVAALVDIVEGLPDHAFDLPGGEDDWTVAQAIGHVADSRGGLALAAALAAQGRWPADAPVVIPGVPGPADASRARLLQRLAVSQKVVERAGRAIESHEVEPCPLVHPWVGRLRCGEWLLFAGVHDLMHLEQVEALEAVLRAGTLSRGRLSG